MAPESPLATFARQANAVNWVAGACMVVLIYNHVLTFGQEINRIWPTRISPAKVLFLINRYIVETIIIFNCIGEGPGHSVNDHPLTSSQLPRVHSSLPTCIFYLRWLVVAITISNATVQGILVLRIWALYRQSKIVLGVVFFFYLGGTITLIGLVIHDYVGEEVLIDGTLASLPGCYATSVPSIIAGFWIGPLIVESVLFVVVISQAYLWWKQGMPVPRILSILMKDSTVYFAIVFALLLANFLVFELAPPFFSSLLVTPSTTAGCILGSHMFLNLRAMFSSSSCDTDAEDLHWNTTDAASFSSTTNGGPNLNSIMVRFVDPHRRHGDTTTTSATAGHTIDIDKDVDTYDMKPPRPRLCLTLPRGRANRNSIVSMVTVPQSPTYAVSSGSAVPSASERDDEVKSAWLASTAQDGVLQDPRNELFLLERTRERTSSAQGSVRVEVQLRTEVEVTVDEGCERAGAERVLRKGRGYYGP